VRGKIWIERDGEPVLGRGRARLLEEIDRTGSIKEASRNLGLSYRYAWGMLSKMAKAWGAPVVLSERGGREGGRSSLTPEGRELLGLYHAAESGEGLGREMIRATVVSVQSSEGGLVLEARRGKAEVTITLRGQEPKEEAREGDTISLQVL